MTSKIVRRCDLDEYGYSGGPDFLDDSSGWFTDRLRQDPHFRAFAAGLITEGELAEIEMIWYAETWRPRARRDRPYTVLPRG